MDTAKYNAACRKLRDFLKKKAKEDPNGDPLSYPEGQRLMDSITMELALIENEGVKSSQPRFCKDCRHIQRDLGGTFTCRHPQASITVTNLVEGVITTEPLECSSMRVRGGICGEEGRLWEGF